MKHLQTFENFLTEAAKSKVNESKVAVKERETALVIAVQQAIELLNRNNMEKANKALKDALKTNLNNS